MPTSFDRSTPASRRSGYKVIDPMNLPKARLTTNAEAVGSNRMTTGRFLTIGVAVLVSSWGGYAVAEEPRVPVVRIAELEIDPAQLERYKEVVKEEMETSVRVEPGVLAIYAVAEKENPTRIRFFEMYADEAAYNAHRESPHFKKYVTTTNKGSSGVSGRWVRQSHFSLTIEPQG